MDWLFAPIQSLLYWVKSILGTLVSFLQSIPTILGIADQWHIFVPSFVLAFFTLNIALGVILFIINRK